jgi:3-phenylpropionate/trans-cinnamate dioxygenase ferredoxin reductase subunit
MSEPYALLVVGGGPAGLSAARAYRDHVPDPGRRVAIVADEQRMPYRRPPLTKDLLRGEMDASQLPLEDDGWPAEAHVDLIGGRAVALDAAARSVTLSGGRELAFQTCLLATGAEPVRLPVPGADHPRVMVVRTLDHVRELLFRLSDGARVTVIGSGFIGCEIAASLRLRGHAVTLVSDETAPNAARLGDEAGAVIAGWLADDGVRLVLGAPVDLIEHSEHIATVDAGEYRIESDLVVMAAGVRPRLELALQAGLEPAGGAVPVDAAMRTSRDGVLAAGDLARADNVAAGRPLRVEHWGDALGQGEVAGATAAGEQAAWDAVPGFWSTIGRRTLKYAAWGDGFEECVMQRHDDGGLTAWYGAGGRIVGVLTHEADADYERGSELIADGAPYPP